VTLLTMKRFEHWIRGNAEVLVALSVAVVFALLSAFSVAGVDRDKINSAILLVLALLAATLLRDRASAASRRRNEAPVLQGSGHDLVRELTDAARTTTSWHHRGGTGTIPRTEILPRLGDGRGREGSVRLRLEIIDPTSEFVRRQYLGLHTGTDTWTDE